MTMKVKALISFSGTITMAQGEIRDIKDKELRDDLVQAGYVEEIKRSRPTGDGDES